MTLTIFASLFMIGSIAASLITEAIKKAFENAGKECPPNAVAMIVAVAVGCAGMIAACILLGIPFNVETIVCIVLMVVSIWIGAMIGYDKVKQLIEQIYTG